MSEPSDKIEVALLTVSEGRRALLRKVVATSAAAFVAPVVASFAIEGMLVTSAIAFPGNSG